MHITFLLHLRQSDGRVVGVAIFTIEKPLIDPTLVNDNSKIAFCTLEEHQDIIRNTYH